MSNSPHQSSPIAANGTGNGISPDKKDKDDRVVVAVRVRPFIACADGEDTDNVVKVNREGALPGVVVEESVNGRKQDKTYNVDHVFTESQQDVYDAIGAPMLQEALNGYNVCIFAYGQTGSGKTYSTMGPPDQMESPEKAGLIYRICTELLEECERRMLENPNLECKVSLSFAEVYKEKVHDLLSVPTKLPPGQPLPALRVAAVQKGKQTIGWEAVDLTRRKVASSSMVVNFLRQGLKHRKQNATAMNPDSSRSHSIATLHVAQIHTPYDPLRKDKESKLMIVDLAGSERTDKTTTNGVVDPKLARETEFINVSLMTLSKCLQQTVNPDFHHVSVRESTLTKLISNVFGGNAKTAMLATVSPSKRNLPETISTLTYAMTAKMIKSHAEVNTTTKQLEVSDLRAQVKALEEALKNLLEEKDRGQNEQKRETSILEDTLKTVLEDNAKLKLELEERVGEIKELRGELQVALGDNDALKGELDDLRAKEADETSRLRFARCPKCKALHDILNPDAGDGDADDSTNGQHHTDPTIGVHSLPGSAASSATHHKPPTSTAAPGQPRRKTTGTPTRAHPRGNLTGVVGARKRTASPSAPVPTRKASVAMGAPLKKPPTIFRTISHASRDGTGSALSSPTAQHARQVKPAPGRRGSKVAPEHTATAPAPVGTARSRMGVGGALAQDAPTTVAAVLKKRRASGVPSQSRPAKVAGGAAAAGKASTTTTGAAHGKGGEKEKEKEKEKQKDKDHPAPTAPPAKGPMTKNRVSPARRGSRSSPARRGSRSSPARRSVSGASGQREGGVEEANDKTRALNADADIDTDDPHSLLRMPSFPFGADDAAGRVARKRRSSGRHPQPTATPSSSEVEDSNVDAGVADSRNCQHESTATRGRLPRDTPSSPTAPKGNVAAMRRGAAYRDEAGLSVSTYNIPSRTSEEGESGSSGDPLSFTFSPLTAPRDSARAGSDIGRKLNEMYPPTEILDTTRTMQTDLGSVASTRFGSRLSTTSRASKASTMTIPDKPRVVKPVPGQGRRFAEERVVRTFAGHANSVYSCDIAADGSGIVSCGKDATVRAWDPVSGRTRWVYKVPGTDVRCLAVTISVATNSVTVAASDCTVRMLSYKTGEVVKELPKKHTSLIHCIRYSRDNKVFATASCDGTVRLWSVGDDDERYRTLVGHKASVYSFDFSPDNVHAASVGDDNCVKIWRWRAGSVVSSAKSPSAGTMWTVRFHPSGRLLATGSKDGTVNLWCFIDAPKLRGQTSPPAGEGQWILKCTTTFPHQQAVQSVVFTNRNTLLAASGARVTAYGIPNCERIFMFSAHRGVVYKVVVSDNAVLTGSADSLVKLWKM